MRQTIRCIREVRSKGSLLQTLLVVLPLYNGWAQYIRVSTNEKFFKIFAFLFTLNFLKVFRLAFFGIVFCHTFNFSCNEWEIFSCTNKWKIISSTFILVCSFIREFRIQSQSRKTGVFLLALQSTYSRVPNKCTGHLFYSFVPTLIFSPLHFERGSLPFFWPTKLNRGFL